MTYRATYLDIGKVSKYEVIFFFNTSLEKQAEGENIQASRHNGHAANIGDFLWKNMAK